MARVLSITVFCEDTAQESLIQALLEKLGRELSVNVEVNPFNISSGSHGKGDTINDLKQYIKIVSRNYSGVSTPDLLVICVDSNCEGYLKTYNDVKIIINEELVPHCAIGCPEPHVEKWYLNDLDAYHSVVGHRPSVQQAKCEKGYYKQILRSSIRKASQPVTSTIEEFADEIIKAMDLFRAGKNDSSFKHFVEEIRDNLKQIKKNK